MSYYKDQRVKITPEIIRVRGVPIPWISSIVFDKADIESLRLTNPSLLSRLMINGPIRRNTWSCYDPFSLIRTRAIVLTLKEPMLGFEHLALTFSDFDAAVRVLRDEYADFIVGSA